MWCEFDVINRSGHKTMRVRHTVHQHAPNHAVLTHRGASLALLLWKSTSAYEDAAFRMVADMVEVDAGTAAAPLRLRHSVVDGRDGVSFSSKLTPVRR